MKRSRIPFIKSKSTIPLIKLKLSDGTECITIIDSGSDATVIDMKFVKLHKTFFEIEKTKDNVNYVGINSASVKPMVFASADYHAEENKNTYRIKAEIFDLAPAFHIFYEQNGLWPDLLIGSDWLKENDAVIDYDKSELILRK